MPQQVSAILLAAGRSRRMGRSKPLLPLADRPVVRHCLDALLAAGIGEIVVVTGIDPALVEAALTGLPAIPVRNPDPDSDMAGSVRVGLGHVSPGATAVLVCLVDHPLVAVASIRALIDRHGDHPASILIPSFRGRRGHPTLFPRAIIDELPVSPTLRDLVRRDPARVRLVEVADEGTVIDMDTPEDYARVLEYWRKMQTG